jgi:hypothetical protein
MSLLLVLLNNRNGCMKEERKVVGEAKLENSGAKVLHCLASNT